MIRPGNFLFHYLDPIRIGPLEVKGIATTTSKIVKLPLELQLPGADKKIRLTNVIITGFRVASVSGDEKLSSGAIVTSTDFDVAFYSKARGVASGLVINDEDNNEVTVQHGLEIPYRDDEDEAHIYVKITHNGSGTADFLVDLWVRPAVAFPDGVRVADDGQLYMDGEAFVQRGPFYERQTTAVLKARKASGG